MKLGRPPPLSTVAVGSLPHTQAELALQQSLRLDIPTLPQLPQSSPAELMLPQALEGLPGMDFDAEGEVRIDLALWRAGKGELGDRLAQALGGDRWALKSFRPSPVFCRSWKPFLWEVEQRKLPFAKAQLTGPLTARWAARLSDGRPVSEEPELDAQILQLIGARALAMAQALRERGTQALIFLDEPGLYAMDLERPTHSIQLDQLRFLFTELRRNGALAGLHCCSNTHWERLLELGPDLLAVDLRLSLLPLLKISAALNRYLLGGGILCLGIVPTHSTERVPPAELAALLLGGLGERQASILSRALLSPACGLGMRTVSDTQRLFEDLSEVQRLLKPHLQSA